MLPGSGFEIAGWDGAARSRTGGTFSYCVVRHAYPNGVELSLARSPEGLFFIGLKNAGWSLRKGDEPKARVAIDEAAGPELSAAAISHDTVLFTVAPRDAAIYSELLSAGSRLTVADLSVTPQIAAWRFDLAGAREALDALDRCVAAHERTAATAAPPD
jgi:hypothetical protein